MTQGQLAWYRAMEERGEMAPIADRGVARPALGRWEQTDGDTDAADRLRPQPRRRRLDRHARASRAGLRAGLRAVGPAHYGPGVYANGTSATGDLGSRGRELLREMERLGIILDATHLCDDSFRDALDHFRGPVWASHSNCRALVPHDRQFTDDQMRELIARGAVIGAAFDAWMLVPGWVRGHVHAGARPA